MQKVWRIIEGAVMSNLIVGIDPGVNTGFAIWNCEKKEFEEIGSRGIVSAMQIIRWKISDIKFIRFEDARQRKWFDKKGIEALQGAGSIKRDCKIWQEFCEYHKFKYEMIKPQKNQTKWTSEYFKKVTGWTGRTNEHGRDAAVLVFGM
jgi:hypothetical protein